MIDSSDKIELGQTKWQTKMRQRLHNKQNTKFSKNNHTSYREVCQIRNMHKIREEKNIS